MESTSFKQVFEDLLFVCVLVFFIYQKQMSSNIISFIISHLGDGDSRFNANSDPSLHTSSAVEDHGHNQKIIGDLFESMLQQLSATILASSTTTVGNSGDTKKTDFLVESFAAVARVVLEKRCAFPSWRREAPIPELIWKSWCSCWCGVGGAGGVVLREIIFKHSSLLLLLFAPDPIFDNVVDLRAVLQNNFKSIDFPAHVRNIVDSVRNKASFIQCLLGDEATAVFAKQLLFLHFDEEKKKDDDDDDDDFDGGGTAVPTKQATATLPSVLLRGTILSMCNEQAQQRRRVLIESLAGEDHSGSGGGGGPSSSSAAEILSRSHDVVLLSPSFSKLLLSSCYSQHRRQQSSTSTVTSLWAKITRSSSSHHHHHHHHHEQQQHQQLDVKSFLSASPTLRYLLVLCFSMQQNIVGQFRHRVCRWISEVVLPQIVVGAATMRRDAGGGSGGDPAAAAPIVVSDPLVRSDLQACVLGLLLALPPTAASSSSSSSSASAGNDGEAAAGAVVSLENDAWLVQSCFQHQLRQKRKEGGGTFSVDLLSLDEQFVYADVPRCSNGSGSTNISPWVVCALSCPVSIIWLTNRAFGQLTADGSDPLCVASGLWLFRLFAALVVVDSTSTSTAVAVAGAMGSSSSLNDDDCNDESKDNDNGTSNSRLFREFSQSGVFTVINVRQALQQYVTTVIVIDDDDDEREQEARKRIHDAVRAWFDWREHWASSSSPAIIRRTAMAIGHWSLCWFLLTSSLPSFSSSAAGEKEHDDDGGGGGGRHSTVAMYLLEAGWWGDGSCSSSSSSSHHLEVFKSSAEMSGALRVVQDTLRFILHDDDGSTHNNSVVVSKTAASVLDSYL